MRWFLSLLCAMALAAQPVQAARTLAFLGDSLTAGFGVDVKAQLPGIWKQKQEQTISAAVFKELRQNYPITFAEGFKPTPQPAQP